MTRTMFTRLRVGLLKLALRSLRFPALRQTWIEDPPDLWPSPTKGLRDPIPTDKLFAAVELERD